MSVVDRVLARIAAFKGQSSGMPPQSLTPSDTAVLNNYILLQGQPKKVNGASAYGNLELTNPSEPVLWLDYFNSRWYAQKASGVFREGSIYDASGSITGVNTGIFDKLTMSSSAKLFSTKYDNKIFLANGRELHYLRGFSWEVGYNFYEWGMLPPLGTLNSANVSVSAAAGGLTSSTTYYWTLTLYNSSTGLESPAANSQPEVNGGFNLDPFSTSDFSPDSWTKTTGASDNTATFTFAEISALITGQYVSANADSFRLYRTDVNADAFKLAVEMKINTFIGAGAPLVDTTADNALGIILDITKGPPPNVARMVKAYSDIIGITLPATVFGTYKHVRAFRDSIFAVGHFGQGPNFFNSVVNIHEPFLPDYVTTSLNVNQGDGQLPTAVGVLNGTTCFIFKDKSAYYVIGTQPDNYQLRVMDTRRGCVHASTMQESPIGVFTIDYSGVVLFDGTGPGKSLSNPLINDVVKRINLAAIANACSGYDRNNEVYYCAVPVDGATQPNLTIVYSVRSDGFSILEGVEGSATYFDFSETNAALAMIGTKQGGNLLDWSNETKTTFITNPIISTYLSGPIYFEDPMRKKRIHHVYITAECAQDFTIDIDIVRDFGQLPDYHLPNVNSASLYATWAASLVDSGATVGVWDASYWGSEKTIKAIKVPVYGIGYVFQIRITNRQADDAKYGFKILAIDAEASIMGQ